MSGYELIREQVGQAVNVIEVFEEVLISGATLTKEDMLRVFGNGVLSVFPLIVDSYELPQMRDYCGQVEYWDNQWNRIQEAVEREDRFYLIDVLSHETKSSFREYMDIVQKVETSTGETE